MECRSVMYATVTAESKSDIYHLWEVGMSKVRVFLSVWYFSGFQRHLRVSLEEDKNEMNQKYLRGNVDQKNTFLIGISFCPFPSGSSGQQWTAVALPSGVISVINPPSLEFQAGRRWVQFYRIYSKYSLRFGY